MTVRFTKARHAERPHTFTCIRDDGTTTGMASTEFFVRHDLTHFAIESTLRLGDAFYGLLAQGWEIDSFGDREPGSRKARRLPAEAMLAEVLAGLLDLDWAAGPTPADEVISLVSERLAKDGLMSPIPLADQIEEVRGKRGELLATWAAVNPGESMDLIFGF